MRRIAAFFRREVVLTCSLAAALLSFLLAAPGAHTLAGIDFGTLLMLFTLMTVVAGLRRAGLFDRLRVALARRVRTLRGMAAALTCACFFLAMGVTNDVALLTLVPFTLVVLERAGQRALILTVALETVAANLGSMVTPIGNPQNLYLYSAGLLSLTDFFRLTWPYALLSLAALLLLTRLLPALPLPEAGADGAPVRREAALLYGALAVVALLAVAKVVPAWAAALVTLIAVLAADRSTLRQVDYSLLATFVCFFVFVASVKQCAPIREYLESVMSASPLLVSLMVSQVISNVPACLLLSPFTRDASALMLGVNLGGLGTLVASLASLISFRLYGAAPGARRGRYLIIFTVLNAAMLLLLLLAAWALGAL